MTPHYPIGADIPRKDGKAKVTGRAKYGADWNLSGQLYAAVYHSPIPHGRILRLDVTRARALPGVRCVLTGAECGQRHGQFIADQPILAVDKVRYVGEPVAAVAADTLRIAKEAVALIEAEYEPLPVVDSIEDALAAESLVHEDWSQYTIYGLTHPVPGSNIIDRYQLIRGDVEQGFAQADVIVESDFYCSMLQHVVMETHAALADATDDELVIYSPAQSPFTVRAAIAQCLGYRYDQVRIVCTEIGGGFGCKAEPKLEPIVAVLSRAARRPVKLVYDRHEEFEATALQVPPEDRRHPRRQAHRPADHRLVGHRRLRHVRPPRQLQRRLRLQRPLRHPQLPHRRLLPGDEPLTGLGLPRLRRLGGGPGP